MDGSIPDRLEADEGAATVTALPDGSVDVFYEVSDGDRRVRRRDEFARAILNGHSPAFAVRRTAVEPGGHAVNMADQAARLGEDVALVGHADDPAFDGAPYDIVSMGDPADVGVYGFDDGDMLLAEPSADIADWEYEDVRAAVGGAFASLLTADVVFWTNWTSFETTPAALRELASEGLDGGYFLFDPGSLSARTAESIGRLFDSLDALADSYDVVLAVNGGEARRLVDGIAAGSQAGGGDTSAGGETSGDDEASAGGEAGTDEAARAGDLEAVVSRIDAATAVEAAVVHESEAAVAATPAGTVRVPNDRVDPVRHTGGGDRFDAGLAFALARGWSWDDALRLGNACASRYIATGESATVDELASFVRERE